MTEPIAVPSRVRIKATHRSGFSLIDAVTMIIAVGVLLSLATITMHRSFQSHRLALEGVRLSQSLHLVGDRFREDVSQASSCTPGESLRLDFSDGRRVSYRVQDDRLTRSTWLDEEQVGEDSWKLPVACQAEFVVNDENAIPWVAMQLQSQLPNEFGSLEWKARLMKGSLLEPTEEARP